jgi:hypothetical protein
MLLDVKRAQIRTKHPACIPIMDKAVTDNNKNYLRLSLLMVVETASSCSSLLTIFTSLLDITPHQKFYSKIPSRGKIRLSTYIQLWQAENATTNICEAQSFVVY